MAILELTQIVEEFGDDNVSEEATYLLGKLNYTDRNYTEALRYYEIYIDKYRDNPLNRAAALAGIAACHENQGEWVQAAAKFVEAANEYPAGPLKGDYQLGAMRNFLEAGDIEAARGQLELIQEEFAGSEWATSGLRLFYEKGQIESGT